MKETRFIQGVRVMCARCKKQITPYLTMDIDDVTGLTTQIECHCLDCHTMARVFK
jgi:RNase P subunit RPR2